MVNPTSAPSAVQPLISSELTTDADTSDVGFDDGNNKCLTRNSSVEFAGEFETTKGFNFIPVALNLDSGGIRLASNADETNQSTGVSINVVEHEIDTITEPSPFVVH
eukprot:TRINITY_DN4428_c0_g1_i3.p2 TRINITY_DN4428_c0_g1~~TRINITY_DN4428_c0_g1_i3.p2  ORF type:complete len:107 (-),score=26.57 TRINITY_DN4428_c0_g1_i3:222-542(-)